MRSSRILRENIPAQNTRLPLIGKIRIGEKRKNAAGVEYPVSLDYFIATGSYKQKFDDVYKSPDRIQIVFISDDDFQSCFEEWEGRDESGRLAGYGDGVTYYLWDYGGINGTYVATTLRDDVAAFSKKRSVKWRQKLTINFIIPAIRGVFGVWQLQTGGDKSSINAIRNTYDEIKELAGTIVNIPFDLCVKKSVSNKPEMKTSYPVISLVPNLSAENMETLRSFLQTGLDIKHTGILTDKKLNALQEHTMNVIELKPDKQTDDRFDEMADAIEHATTRAELLEMIAESPDLFDDTKLGQIIDAKLKTLPDDDHGA